MSFFRWGPKPSVAQQRNAADKKIAELRKRDKGVSPVVIEGRTIAASFWGKSWCTNLERYSDYANRLPRGRSYVRHNCVVDLQIGKGEITAQVMGSSLYRIVITIAPLAPKAWAGACDDCSSSIDSMVELLQGRLSKAVMDRVCRTSDGLFPSPKEIELTCSCPDGAYMCKHVAAVLYGVGARLDSRPELLFVLRGVEAQDLIAKAGSAPAAAGTRGAKSAKVLADDDLAAVFGLDMAEAVPETVAPKVAAVRGKSAGPARKAKTAKKVRGGGRATPVQPKRTAGRTKARPAPARPPRRKNQSAISIT